ncbi:hypothetical protein ACQ4WX_06160 [Streptomyces lasalocidi]
MQGAVGLIAVGLVLMGLSLVTMPGTMSAIFPTPVRYGALSVAGPVPRPQEAPERLQAQALNRTARPGPAGESARFRPCPARRRPTDRGQRRISAKTPQPRYFRS